MVDTVSAQRPETMPRVGYLNPGSSSDPVRQRRLEAFRHGLRELGYVDGQNIAIDARWADGQYDRYPALAADLVRLKVDVIVAGGDQRPEPPTRRPRRSRSSCLPSLIPWGAG